MDTLIAKVNTIKATLDTCRNTLVSHDQNARHDIGAGANELREALAQIDQRIEHRVEGLKSYMQLIEYRSPDDPVDLKDRVESLYQFVNSTLSDLEVAGTKATETMQLAMSYRTQVRDINTDICLQQNKMDETYGEAVQLKEEADRELEESKRRVEEARSEVAQKNRDIEHYGRVISNLRSSTSKQEAELKNANSNLASAKREAAKTKEKALLGAGTALLGAALIPFTFGASGLLLGAGGAYAAATTCDYQDLKKSVASMQSSISSLKSQIAETDRKISSLKQEKSSSETRLSCLESSLQTLNVSQADHRRQITNAQKAKGDVSGLQGRARSMITDAETLEGELQQVKQTLNGCAAALSREAAQLTVKNSFLDRLQPRKRREKREFQRNKVAIAQVLDALCTTRKTVPMMLAGSELKFLETPAKIF